MASRQSISLQPELLSFIDNHPLPSLLINHLDWQVLEANNTAKALLKKSHNDLISSNLFDHIASFDKEKLNRYLKKTSENNVQWTDIIYFQIGEEEICIVDVYGYVFYCDNKLVHQLTLIDRTSFHTQQKHLATVAQRYMDFIEQSSEGIYLHEFATPIPIDISDVDFIQELKRNSYITECNDALARMYGFEKADEMQGLSASLFVDFEDPLNVEYLKLFKRNGLRILDTESKEVDRYGNSRYFLNSLVSVVENGYLKRVWGTQRDITEKRAFERKVRLLTSLVEHTSDVLIAIDSEFNPLTWNPAAEKLFGLVPKQVIGKSLKQYIDIQYQNGSKEEVIVTIHSKGEWRGEISFRRPTDQKIITLFAGYKALYDTESQLVGYIISATDITHRIEVAKQSRLLASLVENTSDVLIAVDLNFLTISWNDAAERISGIKSNQVIGRDVRDLLDLRYNDIENRDVRDILKENGSWHGEMQFLRPSDNKKIILLSTYKLLKDDAGQPIGFIVSCTDITKRKESEWLLQQSEQRFRHLIHDLQVGVLLQDGKGRIIMANKILLDHIGVSEEELKGHLIFEIISTAVTEEGQPIALKDRPLMQVLNSKQPLKGVVIGVVVPKSSEKKWVMLDIHPILDCEGKLIHIITSLIDITERKKLETKLRFEEINHQRLLTKATIDGQEKERREIGKELHDNIGQQLTTIKLYLDLAQSTANSPTDEMVRFALRSVSDLINEIRNISRSLMPPTLGDLGLVDSINDLVESLEKVQAIQVSFTHKNFNEALIQESQKLMLFRIIQEQLNNIVKHAKACKVWVNLDNRSGATLMEVGDDGVGFDPAKVRKGLGLTNMRNRAELFGGTLQINSMEGKGCIIKVVAPAGIAS